MSNSQHPKPELPLYARTFEYSSGENTGWHSHIHAQLIFAISGAMTVDTEQGLWVVPPMRAVWIPAEHEHCVRMNSKVSMRTAYFVDTKATVDWKVCAVVPVSPLLRELLVAASEFSPSARNSPRMKYICGLITEELTESRVLPLHLPQPRSQKLNRVTEVIQNNLSVAMGLSEIGKTVGLSQRTISRLFTIETGLTFSQWRQQAILIQALQHLANDESVTNIALDFGYKTPSAFIHMFRSALGMTPAKYFSGQTVRDDQ